MSAACQSAAAPACHATAFWRQVRSLRWIFAALLIWGMSVSLGFWGLWSYASAPGTAEVAPVAWPAESTLPRTPARWTLVMFVHPRCPCTRASLTELEKLQARSAGQIDMRIAVLQPSGVTTDWTQTSLCRHAFALPGAVVSLDASGSEARRFHARISGEVMLYDPAGRLAYHGGITAARGHEGDNPGSDAILNLIAGDVASAACPAFGCPLLGGERSVREATP